MARMISYANVMLSWQNELQNRNSCQPKLSVVEMVQKSIRCSESQDFKLLEQRAGCTEVVIFYR